MNLRKANLVMAILNLIAVVVFITLVIVNSKIPTV